VPPALRRPRLLTSFPDGMSMVPYSSGMAELEWNEGV